MLQPARRPRAVETRAKTGVRIRRRRPLAHRFPGLLQNDLGLFRRPDGGGQVVVTIAEAAGLFDERYFMYCEDVDFCAAVRAGGGRVYFTPAAEVIHLGGRSAAPTTQEAYRRSQLAFYDKHHPLWAPLLKLYLRLKGEL